MSAHQLCSSPSILGWLFWIFCLQIYTLESVYQYPKNNLLGFWLTLHWLCRSSWVELTFWQYWVLLSINMKYISIYFVLLGFHALELCSFPHRDLTHILLNLYLNILFWGCLRRLFCVLNFKLLLFIAAYRKAIAFHILTLYLTTLLWSFISSKRHTLFY